MRHILRGTLTLAAVLCFASASFASNIGNWIGSSRSWNSGDMSIVRASVIAAGNTVEADEALTAGNLSNDNVLVIGEPTSTPTAGELAALQSWVSGGGILLLFADSGNSGLPALNNIASGIGSSLSWSGSVSSIPTLAGGNFASTGPPFNIVGQALGTSPGTTVLGGTLLATDYIRYQALGSGWVFGFSDRSDHNTFNPDNTTVNGQLFLNIVGGHATSAVPEPTTLVLTALGLGGIIRRRLR